ncbi:hypothetical protein Vretimale_13891 [Volvox reticuliferus]|uniref:Phosphate transporter n=1 Tax=Volvox reticuliferus TaxID=1737510 RepID=A0A8J4GMW0_9CHLO|nr:hypothetical protein Vretifemale_14330 [Volvox reticuliferus]GIM10113.1 hypothetical protein Vretimale_13891 [Volvox reticuliferus]
MAVWSDYTWIVVTGCLAAFFTAYGIGANDVANAFGSSVAARTLTMRQALLIATVCEFGGSVLLGGEVTRTVASGIAKLTAFELNPEIYMYGMLCALVSSGTWLIIATYLELPVSTTHSIAGAVLGFAFVYGGPKAVVWLEPQDDFPYMRGMVPIVVSWFISPLMSGLATAMLFFIVRTAILRRERSLELAFWALPVLVLLTVFINVYFVLFKGADMRIKWSSNKCAWVSACAAAGCTVLTIIFGMPLVRHYVYKDIEARRLQQLSEMENHTRGSCRNSRTCGGSGGCPVLHNYSIRSVEPTPSGGGSGGGVEMKAAGHSESGVSGDSGGCGGGAGSGPAAAIPLVEYRAPPPPPPLPPSTRQRHEHVAPQQQQQQQHLHIGCESASSARQQQACRPTGQPSLLLPLGPAHSSYSSISRPQRTQPLPPLPPPQQQDQEQQLLQPHQKEVGEQPQCRESPAPMLGNCEDGAQLHEGSGGSRRHISPPLSLSLPRQQTTTPDGVAADGVSGGPPDGTGGTISSGGDASLRDHGMQPQDRDGPQILVPSPSPPLTQQQNQEQHLMLQGLQQQQLQPLNIQAPQQMQMQGLPWIHQMQQHQQEQLLLQQQWLNQQWLQQHQQEQLLLHQQWLLQQQPYLQHRNQDVRHPHQQWALPAQVYPQQEQMQMPDGLQQQQQRCQQFPIAQMQQLQSHISQLQQVPPRGMQSTQHYQQLPGQWRAPINTSSASTAAGMQQGYELSQYQYQGDGPPQPPRKQALTPPGPIAESLEWGRKSVAPSPDEDSQGKGAAGAAAADDNCREAPEPKVQWQNTFDQLKAIVLRGTQVAVHDAIITDPIAQRMHTYAEVFDPATEDAFKYLQVVTAICDSFSHGANDVANSVGPLAAIWYIYRFQRVDYLSDLPIWILVLGGAGIVVGLATYGYNIIRAIGVRLSVITPSRGFCIELSTALVVAIASKYGIPLSTTHCQVGATAGMGLMEGSSGLHWRLVMQFFAGWVFTLILTGLMAAALFAAGAYAPCIQQGRDILKYETALLDLATTIDLLLNRTNYATLSDSRTWGNFSAALNATMATGIQSLRMYSQAANTATGTRPVQYINPGPLLDLVNTTMSAYYNNSLPYIGGMAGKGISLPRRP